MVKGRYNRYNILFTDSSTTASTSSSTNVPMTARWAPRTGASRRGCNESGKHNNQEKALYHGLKSAYRMSRPYDGEEYGVTGDVPYETAARIAANVATAYLVTTGKEHTRQQSRDYVVENFADDVGYVDMLLGREPSRTERFGEDAFEAAIEQAWNQVDDKWNHYDAARTAFAAAEMYLAHIGRLAAPLAAPDDP